MSLDQPLTRVAPSARAVPRGAVRALVALTAVAAVVAAGWLWLRDSSLVRVQEVRVTGVTSSAAPRIAGALDAAARGMTTLHVDEAALRRSVAAFPSVGGLRVRRDLPHGLDIEVLERRPVAVLTAGERRLAVTGSGLLLREVRDTMGLPSIHGAALPTGERAQGPRTLAALAVAGAAPEALRRRADRVTYGARGLTVALVEGPPLIFGSSGRAASKWAAAARVLRDPSAAGATYLDLREPGRVAAGGVGPVHPEEADGQVDPLATTPAPTATTYPQP